MSPFFSISFLLPALILAEPSPSPVAQGNGGNDGSQGNALIGDLRTAILTPTAMSIANILLGSESGQNFAAGVPPKRKAECEASTDPCCIWYFVSDKLTENFESKTGQCNDLARAAIRLGFHDAGTWSQPTASAGQDFGGADGSLILFNELSRPENRGLEEVVSFAKKVQRKYGVGMADLIQYMANHATVTCPLGPRVRTFVGRQDAVRAALENLMPDVHAPADALVNLFADKTITPHMLAALLGAHSTSKQFFVDTSKAGQPQDSTPGIWDVSFFNETLQPLAKNGVFRFPSDLILSQDPRLHDEWVMFTDNQDHWNSDYAQAYVRLSLLGVNNINQLTECTATLPMKTTIF